MKRLAALLALAFPVHAQDAAPDPPLADHESIRLEITSALNAGRVLESMDTAFALGDDVAADPDAPDWYAAEIESLVEAYAIVDDLADEDRAFVLAALAARPDPRGGADAAVAALEENALLLADVFGDGHPVVCERYFLLSNLSATLGRWPGALGFAREAVERSETLGDERAVQTSVRRMWLGWIQRRTGAFADAERSILRARATLDRLDVERLGVFVEPRLHAMNYLGLLYVDMGRTDEAEPLFRRYARESRAALGPSSRPHLGALNNLALFLDDRAQSAEAIAIQSECISRALDAPGTQDGDLALLWYNLAGYCWGAGRAVESEEAYERALSALESTDLLPEVAALSRIKLARVVERLGDADRANELADAAIVAASSSTSLTVVDRTTLVNELTAVLTLLGRLDEALAVLDDFEGLGVDVGRWRTHMILARAIVDVRAGRTDEAHAALVDVNWDLEETAIEGTSRRTIGLAVLGTTHARRGNLEQSRVILRRSAESYDSQRRNVAPGFARSLLLGTSPPSMLADVELRLGDGDAAWRTLEIDRSRSLYELLAGAASSPGVRVHVERELETAESQLATLEGIEDAERSDDLDERLLELRRSVVALRSRLALESIGQVEQERSVDEIRASLADDEAFVGWFEVEDDGARRVHAWVLRREGAPRWIPIEAGGKDSYSDKLRALADTFTREARSVFAPRAATIEGTAAELGAALLGGAVASGALDGVRHLVVVPSGFEGFPFESLRVEDEWVGERWTVSYAPSCSIHALLESRARRGDAASAALILGDPPFSASHVDEEGPAVAQRTSILRGSSALGDLARVPRTRDEALAVADAFEETVVLTGRDASEDRLDRLAVSNELARFAVVHLATHALVDDLVPERSGVALSQLDLPDAVDAALRGERPQDGFLSVAEIASRWTLDANLVTLSGCRSALGPSIRGEGHVGLTTAFLQAGAQSVLASLWDVQDEPTMLFMRSFYGHWKNGDGKRAKVEALRRARRELREYEVDGKRPYEHPAFWAAFVLIGAPD